MAIAPETLNLVGQMRVSLGRRTDAATGALTRAWATAWAELQPEWTAAIDDLIASSTDGRWPTRAQIARAERAQAALTATRAALVDLGRQAGVTITEQLPQLTAEALEWQGRITASQYPTAAGGTSQVVAGLQRVDDDAIDAIVRRTSGQVTSLLRPLSAEATAAMRASLVRGVALGQNPREAVRRMVDRVQGRFDGGRRRAETIARTEMLDAHRAAAFAHDQANADTLAGWVWTAELSTKTCPACWSLHGSVHPITDPGPLDHQRGRCARVPKAKSWADLGFPDLDEPGDVIPDGRAAFDALPDADQVAVMGQARLDLLRSGRVSWDDLSVERPSSAWRTSYGVTPVRDLTAPPRRAVA